MKNSKPYKLGVSLSGGGARGFAHIGALKAIEEAGLKPDVISGVSAGSVVAIMYSAGLTPDEMLKVFEKTTISKLVDFRLGGGGLFKIDKFKRRIMKAISPKKDFEDLNLPTYIGLTDLDRGEWVLFNSGPIGDCMIASCSIPIVFKPVKINGVNYVDGGVLRNMPAGAIRDKCERLIGVNVSPMMPMGQANSVVDVAIRTYNLLAKANQRPDMDMCDICVEMREISAYQVFNLKEIEKVCNSGYISMRHALRAAGWWQTDELPPIASHDSHPH